MHIAIFGGAFDPPHLAHLEIARSILRLQRADEVWFLPVQSHAFSKSLSDSHNRLEMLKRLIGAEPHLKIEEFELHQSGVNFTDQTLSALEKKYPEHQFSFIIGSDNLAHFHKWHNFSKLLKKHHVFIYPREGYSVEPLYENMEVLQDVAPITLSSSTVRNTIADGKPFSHLVTAEIASYIKANKLYAQTKD